MGKNSGVLWSDLMLIEDSVSAFEFNRACNIRLKSYQDEQQKGFARLLAQAVNAAFLGEELKFKDENGNETMDLSNIPEAP